MQKQTSNQSFVSVDHIEDLFKMAREGYISAVLSSKTSFIGFDKMEISHFNTPLMNFVVQTYWKRLAPAISLQFVVLGIFAFTVNNVSFEFEGKKYKERIPIPVDPGQLKLSLESLSNGSTVLHACLKCSNASHKVHIIRSTLKDGPYISAANKVGLNTQETTSVDSLMGSLYPCWIQLQKKQKAFDELMRQMVEKPLLLQYVNTTTGNQEHTNARAEAIAEGDPNSWGYFIEKAHRELDITKTLAIVPRMFEACRVQPVVDPNVVDMDKANKSFEDLVDKSILFVRNNSRDGAYAQASYDQYLITILRQQVDDIQSGVLSCARIMYPDMSPETTCTIPCTIEQRLAISTEDTHSKKTKHELAEDDITLPEHNKLQIPKINPTAMDL